ncbi:MAG TPA: threonine synthase [Candidatus Binatia bacterium]|nr:threonine synthase [Candidatus Binatia bacterium]
MSTAAGIRSRGVLLRYREHLPITASTPMITLGEGDTPLIESRGIAVELGLRSLHFKFEGLNPTGSFKDRGMVVAVAKALEGGSRAIICASTGNTSASAAAYGARFGLRTVVVVPAGKIAIGKLVQAQVFGATVLIIEGNFDAALQSVRELAESHPVTLVNSVNPHRIEGQKTAAFEIVDELGDAPDVLAIPVGNAGNITAYWRGFREYRAAGRTSLLPRMIGGQAAGAAPLVLGRPVPDPQTFATAIRIGNPASWSGAVAARDDSEGLIDAVSDAEIAAAQRDLAAAEGIFCEPASAASLAVLRKAVAGGAVARGARAVCVLTGNGLKDLPAVSDGLAPPRSVIGTPASIADAIGL